MELRARTRHTLRRAATMAALGALLVPATAGAATAHAAKTRPKPPVITSVSPMNAAIGETLTVKGRGFLRGRNKNSVVFKSAGQKAVFVKADIGTAKLLKVKLPAKLAPALLVRNGVPVATRFQLRVLATRLSKAYTTAGRSPMVGPELPPAPPTPPPSAADGDCDGDGQTNKVDTDDDNDLLPDTLEVSLKLDPCKADTDGDGVEDGYEYRSAMDLNDDEHQQPQTFLPYPGKRPYPNPLDGTDAKTDYDGDTLTLGEEYRLWLYTIQHEGAPRSLDPLTYSDGEQYSVFTRDASGHRQPALLAAGYDKQQDFLNWATVNGYARVALQDPNQEWYAPRTTYDIRDFNRNGVVEGAKVGFQPKPELTYYDELKVDGYLSDGERDEDADGLTNFDETRGCTGDASYWSGLYNKETAYYVTYGGTKLDDPDTDGDGVRDGADDQDHDDVPNVMECSRIMAANDGTTTRNFDPRPAPGAPGAVLPQARLNPFNPCLPSTRSRTCNNVVPFEGGWAPFNANDTYFYIWN